MATKLINYADEHVVAESSYLGATYGDGRILTMAIEQDIDNGKLLAQGDYLTPEIYKGTVPTATDAVYLVLNPPTVAENFTNAMKNDKYFYNPASNFAKKDYVKLRAYPLQKNDVFTVTAIGITALATAPVVGNYVIADGVNIKEVAKTGGVPTGKAFVGQIIEEVKKARSTSYRIQVIKNA